jgi:hypothetical protein
MKTFCVEKFLPTMRNATLHIQLEEPELSRVKGLIYGSTVKMLYGVLWQVGIFTLSVGRAF